MTTSRWEDNPAAIAEAERFYSFVGQYVISFQWLEGQIDQMFLLARGHDEWNETHHWLAGLRNVDKVNAFRVLGCVDKRRQPEPCGCEA